MMSERKPRSVAFPNESFYPKDGDKNLFEHLKMTCVACQCSLLDDKSLARRNIP
jgi:hypothetical protein